MELKKSSINETWKLCSLAGLLGLFLLAALATNNPRTIDLTNVGTTVVSFFSSQQHHHHHQQQQPPANSTNTGSGAGPEIPTNLANVGTAVVSFISSQQQHQQPPANSTTTGRDAGPEIPTNESTTPKSKCKMYEGRWVYKPKHNPSYHVNQCSFLEEKMSCQRNGRPDSLYEGWSWESRDHSCPIPMFNGSDMLERLRGKRVIIVGDSLNRNMWESLACLLYTSLPSPDRALVQADSAVYKFILAKDYNLRVEFHWAPFLVHLDKKHSSGKTVLSLDRLEPSSERWSGADVMLFNSGHWWTHFGKFRAWDVIENNGEQAEEMEREAAYERALTTWADWLARNVDPTKTKVYFRSISTEHSNAHQWCYNATLPILGDSSYVQRYPQSMMDLVEAKIREINGRDGVHVTYLNITKLSSYRIDAHPSVYRFKDGNDVVMEASELRVRADCSHWCLPGLPDTWNRLFYASLFFDHLAPGQLD